MRDYGIEEGRERGNQNHVESVEINGALSGTHLTHALRCKTDGRCLPLIGISCKGMADLVQPLLVDHRQPLKSRLQGRRGPIQGAWLPLLPSRLRVHDGSWKRGARR